MNKKVIIALMVVAGIATSTRAASWREQQQAMDAKIANALHQPVFRQPSGQPIVQQWLAAHQLQFAQLIQHLHQLPFVNQQVNRGRAPKHRRDKWNSKHL